MGQDFLDTQYTHKILSIIGRVTRAVQLQAAEPRGGPGALPRQVQPVLQGVHREGTQVGGSLCCKTDT